MASSAGWNRGFGSWGYLHQSRPRSNHRRRAEPEGSSLEAREFEAKQAYASAYLQVGLGQATVAFVGDVIAQRVEGRFGTKIRDPHEKEQEVLRLLVGKELAERYADWRKRGVAEKRRKRREEKERRAQEDADASDEDGGIEVTPPLADVSKRQSHVNGSPPCSTGDKAAALGEQQISSHSSGVTQKGGVLSFVHTAFKGVLNLSPLRRHRKSDSSLERDPAESDSNASPDKAPSRRPLRAHRSGPCFDRDSPPGYSLLRSLRMASFAFFVKHPLDNVSAQFINYNPWEDPINVSAVKLAITELLVTPARIALLFTWDSLLQRKLKRIPRKLRTDFRPAVVRSLQVATFENIAYYGLSKEIGLPEQLIYDVVGLPVSLYINYYQSTITAR